jgi:hypothetical protein
MKQFIAIISSCILSFSSAAHADAILIKWIKTFAMVSIPGEVTHGDTLRFVMRKNSCDQAWILFSSYTYTKNPKILELANKRVPVLVNDLKADALVVSARPFLMGYLVMFQVGQGSLSDIIPMFNAYKNYQITITNNDHFKAADYFDITSNTWDVSNIEPSIKRGQSLCIENSDDPNIKPTKTLS